MNEELKIIITAEIKDLKNKLEEVQKQIGDTANKSSALNKIGTTMKNVASTVAKVSAAAFAAVATGVTALTKSAIDNYAEYEQLVGGVDTLFKDSSAKVQQYAANAFKTTGMTANEYMSTVTSFSASLLQSLEGDTEAAANAADKAMVDMADNANKMGTSIESIQNAYQGFAKQNYTMLDNLKLGYGGTKEEMERLIADANAVKVANGEMADLSIESFADVTEAIHIIQTEMGITGTTAKEASTTIQGSAASMKAAWGNLVTGLADENADFDQLLTNFIDSVGTFGANLIPRISIALEGVVKLIAGLAPKIVEVLPTLVSTVLPQLVSAVTNILNGITKVLPSIVKTVVGVIPDIVKGIVAAIPAVIDAFVTVISSLADALPDIVETIVEALPDLIESICEALPELIPTLIEGIVSAIVILCESFSSIIQPIIDYLPEIIISIVTALMDNLPALIDGIITLVLGIVQAIPQIIQGLVDALPTVISAIVSGLLGCVPQLVMGLIEVIAGVVVALPQIFASLVEGIGNTFVGIWNGICEVFAPVGEWFSEKFSEAWQAIEDVFSGIGTWFSDRWQDVCDVFSGIGTWFSDAFSEAWQGVEDAFASVGEFFSGIWETITSTFTDIGTEIGDAVSGAFTTAINWVLEKAIGIINGFIWAINGCIDVINLIPGVSIGKISELEVPELEKGGVLKKGQVGLLEGNGTEAVVPLEKNTQWLDRIAERLNASTGVNAPIVLEVDGKVFAQTSINTINQLTRQNGRLGLNIV